MKLSDLPANKFPIPFANSASSTYKTVPIPTPSQIIPAPGRASLTDGFVPVNFEDIASGGIPPDGRDFNGLLYQMTQWLRWSQAAGAMQYDSAFSTAIGGYPEGAMLASTTPGIVWVSTADDNGTDPDGGSPANWIPLSPQAASNAVTIAGTSTTTFVTPASLAAWQAHGPQFPNALYAQNGYFPLGGGLLLQWGRFSVTGPSGNVTVSFPEAFPSACFSCQVSGGNNTTAQDNQISLISGSVSASQFQARFVPTGTVQGHFQAIGN